jgi:signal transduction histidine kinase
VIGLSVVVARTITRPLLLLAKDARVLAHGDLQHPLALPGGDDEVAQLGRTLEAMRRALGERDAERQMMLAGIAHEVRNPLGGMELFSGLLEEAIVELPQTPSDDARGELLSHARRVRKELLYLTGVVNDFLAFARDTPLQREQVEVRALLDDVVTLCARDGAPPVVVEGADAGVFELDRNRIKQALLNLVENAMGATPVDGRITVRARREGQDELVFDVEDTGKGMDDATLARVFTPFFTTKEKGSGLGLALVRKLARDHGGDAVLTSTLGKGTRVTLTLRRRAS